MISNHPKPLVIGHRGASGYRPEHTLAAYRLAIAQGAEALEPDVVATRDGVLVLRHENEISATSDVAEHPEFADRRRRKTIDGQQLDGWFTEDFSWAELQTLRSRERIPKTRPGNAEYDDRWPILRLEELLSLLDEARTPGGEPVGLVLEIKHAAYFAGIGLPLDELVEAVLRESGWAETGRPLVIECFELGVLRQLQARGIPAQYVFLMEASGGPADEHGAGARSYAEYRSPEALTELAGQVQGISLDKQLLLDDPALVARAQAAGLMVFTWTLRPENRFLAERNRRGIRPAAHGDYAAEWRALMSTGLDGVFADHPDLALAVRAQHLRL